MYTCVGQPPILCTCLGNLFSTSTSNLPHTIFAHALTSTTLLPNRQHTTRYAADVKFNTSQRVGCMQAYCTIGSNALCPHPPLRLGAGSGWSGFPVKQPSPSSNGTKSATALRRPLRPGCEKSIVCCFCFQWIRIVCLGKDKLPCSWVGCGLGGSWGLFAAVSVCQFAVVNSQDNAQ